MTERPDLERGDGRIRAVIDSLSPTVDGGRFPAKRIAGEPVCVEAHCFADGHDQLRVRLRWSTRGNLESSIDEIGYGRPGQRCLDRGVHPSRAGPLSLRGVGLGGSFRIVAQGVGTARGPRRCKGGLASRRCARPRSRGSRTGKRRRQSRRMGLAPARPGEGRVFRAARHGVPQGARTGPGEGAPHRPLPGHPARRPRVHRDRGRSQARRLLELVRAVPAFRRPAAGPSR